MTPQHGVGRVISNLRVFLSPINMCLSTFTKHNMASFLSRFFSCFSSQNSSASASKFICKGDVCVLSSNADFTNPKPRHKSYHQYYSS
ncbi:hypothetical protein L1887_25558 [Cichorium endivia]|nr:hypothetical protein L1887_25558 [Cichorium endivia]